MSSSQDLRMSALFQHTYSNDTIIKKIQYCTYQILYETKSVKLQSNLRFLLYNTNHLSNVFNQLLLHLFSNCNFILTFSISNINFLIDVKSFVLKIYKYFTLLSFTLHFQKSNSYLFYMDCLTVGWIACTSYLLVRLKMYMHTNTLIIHLFVC